MLKLYDCIQDCKAEVMNCGGVVRVREWVQASIPDDIIFYMYIFW